MKYGDEAVAILLDVLNKEKVPYMIVGSFSSNAYGEARSTKDADFVVKLEPGKRESFFDQLPPEFEVDYQVIFETITGHTRQIIKIPSIPFEIELFDLSEESFDQSRFSRRLKTTMLDKTVWLPTAEDVVVQKLRWAKLGNRPKDFLDALGILKVRKDGLDWSYISKWCDQLDISDKLEELMESGKGR